MCQSASITWADMLVAYANDCAACKTSAACTTQSDCGGGVNTTTCNSHQCCAANNTIVSSIGWHILLNILNN